MEDTRFGHKYAPAPIRIMQLTQGTMQQHDSTADLAIQWKTQNITSACFTHSTSTNSHQITCNEDGWVDVRYSIQYDQDDTARLNTTAYLTLNGSVVDYSTGNRTYYRGLTYGKWGTANAAFYLPLEEDDVIELHSGVAVGNTNFTLNRQIDTVPDITWIQLRHIGGS